MKRKICNVEFEIREDVIEVAARRYKMAGINVTNKLLESLVKDFMTIQGVVLDQGFKIKIIDKGVKTRNCKCGKLLEGNENIRCAECRKTLREIIE